MMIARPLEVVYISEMLTTDLTALTEFIFKSLGKDIKVATPLGLGKPNPLLNALYDCAVAQKDLQLSIFTALSLAPPAVKEDLAARFFNPFKKRHWGEDYPLLKYYAAAQKDQVPSNIKVHEFYFQAGTALGSSHLQRNYQSMNYTHVAENLERANINLIVQLIAKKETPDGVRYSLSCNPDVTLDVVELFHQNSKKLMMIGVVHPDLPFLEGDAEVKPAFFDAVLDAPAPHHQLFALPRMPISIEDHLIGLYASLFVKDGGTIQIGIGSLSDAIVHFLLLREKDNAAYRNLVSNRKISLHDAHLDSFSQGLYGLTEMLTDGFMHLRKAGILKRHVIDESTGLKTFVHGSFILGSKDFYEWLRNLPVEDKKGLRMTRVSKVNDLYDPQETLLRKQRVHARFFNTTMQVSLLGEAASETLYDTSVVSGVGGQYNFVSMSHELKNARSILMLRSVRIGKTGKRTSNIIWKPGHFTIPRHLRDVIVTEYGLADIRGKSDEECIQAILNITDSEFQAGLLAEAKKFKKISADYEIPAEFTQNTPQSLTAIQKDPRFANYFKPFPFGSDFTPEEENLVLALQSLQDDQKKSTIGLLVNLLKSSPDAKDFEKELTRMGLWQAPTLKEKIYRKLLLQYLGRHAFS